MNFKKKSKVVVDVAMSIILLFLMAFQVTGDNYHEWLGAGMLLLFLIHNALNFGWYQSLFKGNYSAQRIARTIVNLAALIAILVTGYSGIVLSRHVFSFLPIEGGMATARKLHLAGSYWSFVLMSVHLGMHWSMVLKAITRKQKAPEKEDAQSAPIVWILRIAVLAIAIYGAFLFGKDEIFKNMFLLNEFAILDYETTGIVIMVQNLIMMFSWSIVGFYLINGIIKFSTKRKDDQKSRQMLQGISCMVAAIVIIFCGILCTPQTQAGDLWQSDESANQESHDLEGTENAADTETTVNIQSTQQENVTVSDEFIFVTGGTYEMGSPESENWRSQDEVQHSVTVQDFYMSAYELTQEEYEAVMGENPSTFSGDYLPVENISWQDAVRYCNARSEQEGLTPAYLIEEDSMMGISVSWNRGADGYRLPTEAEWEYACRAGTTTPFHTENSISAEEANYYGHYPYDIEENYFEQENLSTQPGQYRQTTVSVESFSPNAWGFYNMHGNVSEWVWDYYGAYETEPVTNPSGPTTGNLKVYRGGGWNDFAKNMRSAYRATLEEDMASFNIGIRLVRNAVSGQEDIVGMAATENQNMTENESSLNDKDGKILIAYFSWGGNTKGIAEEIQAQTGADVFEITLVEPYSDDYNTVLDQSQRDQNIQARPEIADQVTNMEEYDTILLGYPNWWASIPMPIASFLEEYDFSEKTIIPFCSHGGGRFGQSLTAIAKLVPDASMGEALSVHYSGGSSLSLDVEEWLRTNGLTE